MDIIRISGSNDPWARRNISCLKVGVFDHDSVQQQGEKQLYVETSGTVWARGEHGGEEAGDRPTPSSASSRSITHPTCPQKPLHAAPWPLQSLPTCLYFICAPRLRESTPPSYLKSRFSNYTHVLTILAFLSTPRTYPIFLSISGTSSAKSVDFKTIKKTTASGPFSTESLYCKVNLAEKSNYSVGRNVVKEKGTS